jgi:hypothetical protein
MPSVQIGRPSAGETLYAGTTYIIQWTSFGATNQRVQYSTDNGFSYTAIQTGLAPDIQEYAWTIPSGIVPDGQGSIPVIVRVLVRDTDGADAMSGVSVTIANPVVTSVVPSHGPLVGGTRIEIHGQGFARTATSR